MRGKSAGWSELLPQSGFGICRVISGRSSGRSFLFRSDGRLTQSLQLSGTVGSSGSSLFWTSSHSSCSCSSSRPHACVKQPRSCGTVESQSTLSYSAMSRISFERRVAILSRYSTRRQGFESCLCLHVSFTTQSLCSCVGKIWLPNPPSHGAHPNLRRHSTSYIPSCACALEPDYMALARADSPG